MATGLEGGKYSCPKLVRERRVFSDNPSCDTLIAATSLVHVDCSLLSVKKRHEDVQLLIAAARLHG